MEKDEVIVAEQWRLIKKIGNGAFGEIFLAEDLKTNKEVAIKLELQSKPYQ